MTLRPTPGQTQEIPTVATEDALAEQMDSLLDLADKTAREVQELHAEIHRLKDHLRGAIALVKTGVPDWETRLQHTIAAWETATG